MKANSKLFIVLGVVLLASCSTELPIPITGDVDSGISKVSSERNARTANSIGNGMAYGLPLSTGINFRATNVSWLGSSQKFVRVERNWFPSPKTNVPLTVSITYINATQSDLSVSASAGITSSGLKGLISAAISAAASKTDSKSITLSSTESVTVPAMKQVRLSTYEQRKLYSATLVRIEVIGSPLTATIANGRLKVSNYAMSGSMPTQLFTTKEWR